MEFLHGDTEVEGPEMKMLPTLRKSGQLKEEFRAHNVGVRKPVRVSSDVASSSSPIVHLGNFRRWPTHLCEVH